MLTKSQQAIAFVEAQPGCDRRWVAKTVGCSLSLTRDLVRTGLLASTVVGHKALLFPAGVKGDAQIQRELLALLRDRPGIEASDLQQLFGDRWAVAAFNLGLLIQKGHVAMSAWSRSRRVMVKKSKPVDEAIAQQVIQWVEASPGISQLALSAQGVSAEQLNTLVSLRRVRRARLSGCYRFFPNWVRCGLTLEAAVSTAIADKPGQTLAELEQSIDEPCDRASLILTVYRLLDERAIAASGDRYYLSLEDSGPIVRPCAGGCVKVAQVAFVDSEMNCYCQRCGERLTGRRTLSDDLSALRSLVIQEAIADERFSFAWR